MVVLPFILDHYFLIEHQIRVSKTRSSLACSVKFHQLHYCLCFGRRGGQNRGPFGPNQATDIQADFQILSRGIACPLALIVALGMFLFSYFVMSIELLNALHQIDAYTIWQVQVNDFSPMSEAGDRVETGGSALIDEATGSEANGLALIAVSKAKPKKQEKRKIWEPKAWIVNFLGIACVL
ncbi:uncharacterized protein [Populus alba]|uniref:uncharacterized protein isoform X2 n=1 Tax=Populus alba TaxID=43335 RepID=UPI003CC76024